MIQRRCVLCYFGLEKLKKDKFGHSDNEPKITEKKILVSTRTADNITIKCTGRVATKAAVRFVMSACQFARLREISRFTYLLTYSMEQSPS